jgi:hypothetical protein
MIRSKSRASSTAQNPSPKRFTAEEIGQKSPLHQNRDE